MPKRVKRGVAPNQPTVDDVDPHLLPLNLSSLISTGRTADDEPVVYPLQENLCYSPDGHRLQPHQIQKLQRSSRRVQMGSE